jgi:chloride channel protein, CIC family
MEASALLRRFRQLLLPRQVAVFEACVIGLVSALAAGTMAQGVGWLGGWRVALSQRWPAWWVLPVIGALGGLLSGWLIQREAPEASGSGFPQVKAVLFRVPMPLNLRVALVKLISAVLALSSGFALGREGPTVQVGAALAAQLSHWLPTTPEQRRQLIAAGAGAGVAAAFNTPISGVLLVAEQLLQDVSGGTLGTAILASFIGSSVSRWIGGNSLDVNLDFTLLFRGISIAEVPTCLALGLLAGMLAAGFDRGVLQSLRWNRQYLPIPLSARMALAGLVSGLMVAFLPLVFRDYTGLKDGLLSGQISWQSSGFMFVSYFVLVLIGYGSGAPGGLLVPTLILGALLGNFVGLLQDQWWGLGQPAMYTYLGMAAFMGATAKAPITAIVTVFELTRDFNLVLPLMVVVVVAYLACERLFPGSFYDKVLELNGISLDPPHGAEAVLGDLTAAQVMQRQVETLPSQMTLEQALQVFSQSHHRGFPVIEAGKLVGIVTQSDLQSTGKRSLPADTPLQKVMTTWPVTVEPNSSLAHVLYLLNRFNLSRLPVVEGKKLVGIITRTDIIRAEAQELSGERQQLAPRQQPSYLVYQTRGPATGQGRVLVPLANPETMPGLLQIATAIAQSDHQELEFLQVIHLPRHCKPNQTPVRTTLSRQLLHRAQVLTQHLPLSVHTQIRVGTDVASAILDAIQERHIDTLVMGWDGQSGGKDWIFGSVVDTIIREAPCEVVLVKFATQSQQSWRFQRWLIPLGGGGNAPRALQLLPGLTGQLANPQQRLQIRLCQVFPRHQPKPDTALLDYHIKCLKPKFADAISQITLCSESISEAILDLSRAEQDDVIMLGASESSLLRQMVQGNIPATVARKSDCTIILVRECERL